jgi:hypothetical protein
LRSEAEDWNHGDISAAGERPGQGSGGGSLDPPGLQRTCQRDALDVVGGPPLRPSRCAPPTRETARAALPESRGHRPMGPATSGSWSAGCAGCFTSSSSASRIASGMRPR